MCIVFCGYQALAPACELPEIVGTLYHDVLKVAGAGYYNKILFITKHGNMCDVSVRFIKVR